MAGQAVLHTTPSPLALQTIAAAALVALLVAAGLALVYAVVAGSAAWVLLLIAGLVRAGWSGGHAVVRTARAHLRSAAPTMPLITAEGVPDRRVGSSG